MNEITSMLIVAGVILLLFLAIFIKNNLKICQPNEILIFSGRKRKLADGTKVGYRIVKGGRGFRIPIVEAVSRMSLTTMPIEIEVKGALCKGIVPINIQGVANVKIAGSEEEGLGNAVERFLGKSTDEIAKIAKETLEGNLRGVLATMSPEEANNQRLAFAEKLAEAARTDLRKLGLTLDTIKIQNISDETGYLDAIGRKRNAEVQKDARIVEAESNAAARQKEAEAKKTGNIAEVEAEKSIIEAENQLRIRKAELAMEANRTEEKAKLAGEITRVTESQKLEEYRIETNKRKYQADVVVPAEAEKDAQKMRAVGEAAKTIEEGKAKAEAVRLMRQEWEKGNTRELFLIQQLPDIIDKLTRVISENLSIEKLTIVDSGNSGGIPTLVKGITGSVVSIFEQIKNATGLDIPEILQNKNRQTRS